MKITTMVAMTAFALVIGSTATAGTIFSTTTNDLGGNHFQLVSQFTINVDLTVAYKDSDLNGTIDSQFTMGGPADHDSDYTDPENYVLDLDGDTFYLGNQLTMSGTVDWSLNSVSTAGDASTSYSTILFGTATGGILTVRDSVWWPVSGGGAGPFQPASGERWGYAIGDFDTFTWDSVNGTLVANMAGGGSGAGGGSAVPEPGTAGMAALALALGAVGFRRRRRAIMN
ncbi:MAG: PEP-CTERM sorting domain-containing protein [Gammaproteobacteria bacterium]|nr:PEP-CTERM sorting domain-containing protein [Gammaproteobacteria bacterium]